MIDGGVTDAVTVTNVVAEIEVPSNVVAVIVAVPAPTPVTTPVVVPTVATELSDDDQVRFGLEALFGVTVAEIEVVAPVNNVVEVVDSDTPVTNVGAGVGLLTVTTVVAEIEVPSNVVAVIVAVPAPTPVTTPVVVPTVATELSDDDQVRFGLEALFGVTVAEIEVVAPVNNVVEVVDSDTPVTNVGAGVGLLTVTTVVAEIEVPSNVVAVIVAVPAVIAVTTPVVVPTVATELSDDDQVRSLLLALFGVTVAEIEVVAPVNNVVVVGDNDTPVTNVGAGVGLLTVTTVVAENPPSAVVAVIVAVPAVIAVTTPVVVPTVATELSDDDQVRSLLLALFGVTVKAIEVVAPVNNDVVVGVTDTPVTNTGAGVGLLTVTNVVAEIDDPSNVVAVIVAVPAVIAVITPVVVPTVATELSDDDQVRSLLLALFGVTVAEIEVVAPVNNVVEVVDSDTPVTNVGAGVGLLTVTTVVAEIEVPSNVVAVIVAVPAPTPVTTPVVVPTVATELSDDDQVRFGLEALFGVTVAEIEVVAPVNNVVEVVDSDTPVTNVGAGVGLLTVTTVVAEIEVPSNVVAVIVAVPAVIAVTTPVVVPTVATELSDDDQVRSLLLALFGVTVAEIEVVAPVNNVVVVGDNDTPVTNVGAGVGLLTVTTVVAENPPSAVVAVIVAVPAVIAVTTPVVVPTVATELSDDDQVRSLLLALFGVTVKAIEVVAPVNNDVVVGVTDTPVTNTGAGVGLLTVTNVVAEIDVPSTVVAVIVAVPAEIAVTTPVVVPTVATELSDEDQVRSLLLALFGVTVKAIEVVAPVNNDVVVGVTDTPKTWIIGLETVTIDVVENTPSAVVAVTVDVPGVMAVIIGADLVNFDTLLDPEFAV